MFSHVETKLIHTVLSPILNVYSGRGIFPEYSIITPKTLQVFECKFMWHIPKIHEIQHQQLEMLNSFLQSTYCLLPADSLYWTQWKLYEPVSGSNIAEKEWAITANEECVIFSIFSWIVKQKHKESKQIIQGHTKNSTKIPNHRTCYILVVTKIYLSLHVTQAHSN